MAPKKDKTAEAAAEATTEQAEGATSTTETTTDSKGKRQVAVRDWINAAGEVVKTEEEATGIQYKDLESGKTFQWQSGGDAGQGATMLACFGALTLAGNVRSGWFQADGDKEADAIEAITARFALIDSGKWIDRASGERGPKIDPEAMADALIAEIRAQGKEPQARDVYVQKLIEDKAYAAKVRSIPQVKARYDVAKGKTKGIDAVL